MRVTALVILALVAGGCVGDMKRDAPEPSVYVLTPPAVPAGATLPADLEVLRPVAAPALRTDRIATRLAGNRMDYYAGARWGGELRMVVQSSVVESVRATMRFRTVQAEPGSFRATHLLGVEVSHFEVDYSGGAAPVARVTLTATVARRQDRHTLASWTATAEQPATANTLTAVTAALDQAFGSAAGELVGRTGDTVAADLARQP
jgi:cholesterol transport system auxiliary component